MSNINDSSSSSSSSSSKGDNDSTISVDFAIKCDIAHCDSLDCEGCTNAIIDAVVNYEDTEFLIDAVIAYEDY